MSTLKDFRFAVRGLARRPGLTAIAVLTLALGIGANTAIFSIVDAVVLHPLGLKDEERLYAVLSTDRVEGSERSTSSLGDYYFFAEEASTFDELSFYYWQPMTLEEPEHVEQLSGVYVGENIFRMLGVQPHAGRLFTPEDAAAAKGQAVLVSYELWQRLWGGDPAVVGRTIRLDDDVVTLAGVLPPATAVPRLGVEIWRPLGRPPEEGTFDRSWRDFVLLGSLATGVSADQAQAEMEELAAHLAEAFPETNQSFGVAVVPWRHFLVGGARGAVLIAFAAVVLVQLIACANIAHLLLVRSTGRARETAVRAALGAGRWHLVRQPLAESLVLAFLGGAFGVLLAAWLQELLLAFDPGIPYVDAIELDARVLLFTLATALLTGLGCGLVPALRSSAALSAALHDGGRRTVGGGGSGGGRLVLLGSEIALALVLLCGAGLLIRTLYELHQVDPGFEPAGTYAAWAQIFDERYDEAQAQIAYFRRLRDEVAAIPGVEAAALTTKPPAPGMGGAQIDVPYRGTDGPPLGETGDGAGGRRAALRVVSPGYPATLGIPLLEGRDFDDHDDESSSAVVLVNRTLAERLWPGDVAVGRPLQILCFGELLDLEVVGVLGDTRFAGLHEAPRPALFLPYTQRPFRGMAVVVSTRLAQDVYTQALHRAALEIDPRLPPNGVSSLERSLERSVGSERFFAMVLAVFAVLALVLAAAGVYGVFSYWVSQRTNEIGVRMALGADAAQVERLVVVQGLRVTAVGLAAGLAGALATARILQGTFHGVGTADPMVLVSVATLLVTSAALACYVPARRASRIQPSVTLRSE